jgi:hypothetical protein
MYDSPILLSAPNARETTLADTWQSSLGYSDYGNVFDYYCDYVDGWTSPHYPVPAIREGYEFGWQLGHGVVLLHYHYGRYPVDLSDGG